MGVLLPFDWFLSPEIISSQLQSWIHEDCGTRDDVSVAHQVTHRIFRKAMDAEAKYIKSAMLIPLECLTIDI